MRAIRFAHRWTGGFIGLMLLVLGLSGTLLAFKDDYLRLVFPPAREAPITDPIRMGAVVETIQKSLHQPRSVILATDGMGLHRVAYAERSQGAYVSQWGEVLDTWTRLHHRPEVWLFELHHYLLAGDTGKAICGIVGLAGMGFIITGIILWWPTRRMFSFQLWPKVWTRFGIIKHHRDMGVWIAPLLALVILTGCCLALKPMYNAVAQSFSNGQDPKTVMAAPEVKGGPLPADFDWAAAIAKAQRHFPDGEIRIIAFPRKPGDLISMRLRRAQEWLPNGRSQIWFDPATGQILQARDGVNLPTGLKMANSLYPLHAGKVWGLPYRLVVAATGVGLTLLGSLAVATFWGNPRGVPKRRKKKLVTAKA